MSKTKHFTGYTLDQLEAAHLILDTADISNRKLFELLAALAAEIARRKTPDVDVAGPNAKPARSDAEQHRLSAEHHLNMSEARRSVDQPPPPKTVKTPLTPRLKTPRRIKRFKTAYGWAGGGKY
jgi:hypothetical protein